MLDAHILATDQCAELEQLSVQSAVGDNKDVIGVYRSQQSNTKEALQIVRLELLLMLVEMEDVHTTTMIRAY